jgi:curved DNA-binding protein CbpA
LGEPITSNAYAILGVTPESDDETIVAAYRALARRHHPDIAGEPATERMTRVNAAFQRLRTPERRAAYDLELGRGGIAKGPLRPEPDGTGAAGTPPGRASGSVLGFGRHLGWSIGEIARVDPGYLVWLEDRREGRPYLDEIDRTLRATGYRVNRDAPPARDGRRR